MTNSSEEVFNYIFNLFNYHRRFGDLSFIIRINTSDGVISKEFSLPFNTSSRMIKRDIKNFLLETYEDFYRDFANVEILEINTQLRVGNHIFGDMNDLNDLLYDFIVFY